MTAILVALLPLIYWWRFKDAMLDRDYGPYAYMGVFNTGYLKGGHRDIKPPLIHWSYKLWLGLMPSFNLSAVQRLRLLPTLTLSMACLLIGLKVNPCASIVLALLLISQSLWPHMANTEWLTLVILGLVLAVVGSQLTGLTPLKGILACVLLGLLPWINQKNILLLVPVAWAMGISFQPTSLAVLFAPSLILAIYIAVDPVRRKWLWEIPRKMGKERTLKANTLQALHLLTPFLYKFALVLTICDWSSPWFIVLLIVIGMTISVKQVVPHHFILWTFPLAMCASPTPLFWVAWAILWVMQDWPIWQRPELLYPLTFRYRQGGHYGVLLDDAAEAARWIRENSEEGESIWVNGFENNIYLEANRPSACMQICEAPGETPAILPRIIVHCATSAQDFDYEGYEHAAITTKGLFTVMRRKELKLELAR